VNVGKANSGANTDITSLNAPALGAATADTQAANNNSTKVATTAYADRLKIATQVAPGADGNVLTSDGAGAWVSEPPATPPTELVAIRQIVSVEVPYATANSYIPYDTSTPLSTEGTQLATASITPSSASNKVRVRGSFLAGSRNMIDSSSWGVVVAVFRGTTCIGSMTNSQFVDYSSGTSGPGPIAFEFLDSPATTSATTYSIRIGCRGDTGGNIWKTCGDGSTTLGGTLNNSLFTLEEINV
jgi:hypothetical protein